jgi:hypothetical protein
LKVDLVSFDQRIAVLRVALEPHSARGNHHLAALCAFEKFIVDAEIGRRLGKACVRETPLNLIQSRR